MLLNENEKSVSSPVALVVQAALFAAERHRDQRRKNVDATPYINHPLALASVLSIEAQIDDPALIAAALLHDTVEDTQTTIDEIEDHFGSKIAGIVAEVTDDKSLEKEERKRKQVETVSKKSTAAKLIKLADKTSNLRDIASSPPADWPLERRQAYFDWAVEVIDGCRGTHPMLEELFDAAFQARPQS
ncbi:phosphohydrolase [Sphingomonadales bacterium EhC05]|nr:phosphohydrolase [Sphingomonadales bacterium EhC05]